jgi:glycosyltransferase involved in cell wall biosynthesis
MKVLMISLDKKILDKDSRVAQRMVEYGKKNDLFILIPYIKKESLDLSKNVHIESTGGNKIQQFFRLKKIGNNILKKEKIDLITTQDPFFTGLIGWLLKKKFKIDLEVQLHGDFFSSYYKKKNLVKYYLGKIIIKKADKLRVVGERIKKSLIKLGVDKNKIEVKRVKSFTEHKDSVSGIYIDLKKDYPEFEKRFIIVGRLEPVKNIEWLIKLFVEVIKEKPKYGLFIIGDGSQKNYLKNLVNELNLKNNIIFTGWIELAIASMSTADALLFPSKSEGYGLVVNEALSINCPVIMNDVGVAGYEVKVSDKVKIISVSNKNAWIEAILNI